MKNELALKVYEVDYDFIIKNYLSPSLWEKTWNLFIYKDISITLNIDSISVKPRKIFFDICIRQGLYNHSATICHHLDNSNYNVLKKQINSTIEDLISYLERDYIRKEETYLNIKQAKDKEEDILRNIAEEYLDDNNVTNYDIREVYIDNYVDNNTKTDVYLSDYLDDRKYKCMSDLWLVYYKAIKTEDKYNHVLHVLQNGSNFQELITEIDEYISVFDDEMENSDEYDDYISVMQEKLEEI